jgi:hypothetical protein
MNYNTTIHDHKWMHRNSKDVYLKKIKCIVLINVTKGLLQLVTMLKESLKMCKTWQNHFKLLEKFNKYLWNVLLENIFIW